MHTAVKVSKLSKRFDVRYHLTDEKDAGNSWLIEELKDIVVRDPNCYGFKYARRGIPIIRISDLKEPFVDLSKVALISNEVHQKYKKTQLHPFDVLISVRGMSTGKISIFLGESKEANISPNLIIVRLKNTDIAPYVAMVLLSDIGQHQIKRFLSGGGKPSLTAPMVNAIKIPKPSMDQLKQVNLLFYDTKKKREEGKNIINEIRSIFEKEFSELKIDKSTHSVKYLSDLSERWDPHYHNDGFVELRKYIENFKGKKRNIEYFGKEKNKPKKNLNKREKIEYIEITSINNLTGIVDNPKFDYPDLLPKSSKEEVVNGDILISKVRPYLNSNALFIKGNSNHLTVASKNAFTIFNTENSYYKYYLAAYLRNDIGLCQIEMYQSGTSYPTVSDDDIKKVIVIEINELAMEKINFLYKQYVEIKTLEEFTTNTILELLNEEKKIQ